MSLADEYAAVSPAIPAPTALLLDLLALWQACHGYLTAQAAVGLGDDEAAKALGERAGDLLAEHNRIYSLYIEEIEQAQAAEAKVILGS